MSARDRNFGIAMRERERRIAGLLDDPYDTTAGAAISDPAGNAFYGSLREMGQRANEAGMGFRADLGGIGRDDIPRVVQGFYPTSRESQLGNIAAARYVDESRASELARRVGTAAAQQAEAGARAAQREEQDISDIDRAGAIANLEKDPMSRREALLSSMPAHIRPIYEAKFAADDARQQSAQLEVAKFLETQRKNRATEEANAPPRPVVDASGKPITGPAVLDRVPDAVRGVVQAVLDGRQALPTGTATKDPYWKNIIQLANQADPTFDAVNYNARSQTRNDFTKGKAAGQINAINTVAGHLHDLATEGDKLGNFGLNWVNSIYNMLTPGGTERGVHINNFETLKEGVANELMRVWRQVGAGSEKEIEDWKATIGATKSPQELRGAFKTIGGMLESKLDALDTQYKQGMGTQDITAISPESREKLDKLQGRTAGGAPSGSHQKGSDPGGIR